MQFIQENNVYYKSILKRAAALVIMILITVSSVVTVAASTCNANIDYNGQKKSVQLFSSDTGDILNAAGINVGAKDLIVRSSTQDSGGDINITVRSAYEVKVSADNKTKTVTVHFGDTVADAVNEAGMTPGAKDVVTPSEDTKASNGMNVQLNRKFNVAVTADGKTKSVLVTEGTVEKALGQAGISIGSKDIISMDKAAAVSEGMKLKIARVTFQEVTTKEDIAYKNTDVKDKTIRKGVKKVQTAGKNGSRTIVTRQKLVDGKVADSELVTTNVDEQPVDQVTLIGTKKKASSYASIDSDGSLTDQSGSTVNYQKLITGRCTAYTGGGTTSTGRAAKFGLVAVNPSIIPYGSKLYICSADGKTVYGYAIAADTGGGVMDGRIIADLYYSSASECQRFGIRNMRIYIL